MGLFVYFDHNDVNVSNFAYVTRLPSNLWKKKKVMKQCENKFLDSKIWPGKLKVEIKY